MDKGDIERRDDLVIRLAGIAAFVEKDLMSIERGHLKADLALLDYIDDDTVRRAFANVPRTYEAGGDA